jgi:hypothetical protein
MVFWGLRFQADQELSARLDANQYMVDETIEFKIPVNLPYPFYEQDFQRVNGKFVHDGEIYKLVKQKLENDTLYVVCIRDHQVEHLESTLAKYEQLTNEVPASGEKSMNFLGKLLKDYCFGDHVSVLHVYGFSTSIDYGELNESFLSPVISLHAPPPKV